MTCPPEWSAQYAERIFVAGSRECLQNLLLDVAVGKCHAHFKQCLSPRPGFSVWPWWESPVLFLFAGFWQVPPLTI